MNNRTHDQAKRAAAKPSRARIMGRRIVVGGSAVALATAAVAVGTKGEGHSAPFTRAELVELALHQSPSQPFTFQENQGEKDAIAAVAPDILTADQEIVDAEIRNIDAQLPEGHETPHPGDTVNVDSPIINEQHSIDSPLLQPQNPAPIDGVHSS